MDHQLFMYVSQWALHGGAPGLSLYSFDTETGAIKKLRQIDDSHSFGCSLVDEKRMVLYVCNECDLFPEMPMNSGRVYCYRIDPSSGDLTELNHKETYCPFASYVNMDPTGQYLMVSNHSWDSFTTTVVKDADGTIRSVMKPNDSLVNLFEINEDGSIGQMVDVRNHGASGDFRISLLGRPQIPHPHCVMRSPSGKLYAVCDKGDGHIYLYTIEGEKLKLVNKTLTDTPQSEPRYCVFHPTKPYLYVNHEHTPGDRLTLTTFRYDEAGMLEEVGKLYADVSGHEPKEAPRQQQGMCISPDGRFVYTQAHGYNLLLVLAVDEQTGALRQIQAVPISSVWPRAVTMSPDGRFLINCCLGGQITVYTVAPDGTLTDTGHHSQLQGSGYVSFLNPMH